jgi:hypothetical protein
VFSGVVTSILIASLDGFFMALPTRFLYNAWGEKAVLMFWFLYMAVLALLLWSAKREQRLALNPMHQFIPYLPNTPQQPRRTRSWLSSFLFR